MFASQIERKETFLPPRSKNFFPIWRAQRLKSSAAFTGLQLHDATQFLGKLFNKCLLLKLRERKHFPTQKQKLFPDSTSSKIKSSAAFTGLQLHDATQFLGKLFNKCLLLKLRERKHFSHPEAKTFSRFDELKDLSHRLLLRDCNYMTQLSFLVNYSTNVCFSNWEKGNIFPPRSKNFFPIWRAQRLSHRLLLRDCNYMTQLSFLVNYSTNVCFSNWEKGNISPSQKQKLFPNLTSSKTKFRIKWSRISLHMIKSWIFDMLRWDIISTGVLNKKIYDWTISKAR